MSNSFKSFLTEFQSGFEFQKFPRAKEITKQEAIEIIKKHCSHNFAKTADTKNQKIWRGSERYTFDYGLANSESKRLRIAANAASYIMAFMSGSNTWKDYPPRNKSFICTTENSYADTYGTPKIMIPFDGTKIGMCSKDDIFGSFKLPYEDMNHFLSILSGEFGLHDLSKTIASYESLVFFSEKLMEIRDTKPDHFAEAAAVQARALLFLIPEKSPELQEFMNTGNVIQFLEQMFTPKENGFTVTTNIANLLPEKEIWFAGKALVLTESSMENLSEELL